MPRRKCPWGEYIEYFEDKAKASLRAQFETDAEIGQKGAFFKGLKGLAHKELIGCNHRDVFAKPLLGLHF